VFLFLAFTTKDQYKKKKKKKKKKKISVKEMRTRRKEFVKNEKELVSAHQHLFFSLLFSKLMTTTTTCLHAADALLTYSSFLVLLRRCERIRIIRTREDKENLIHFFFQMNQRHDIADVQKKHPRYL